MAYVRKKDKLAAMAEQSEDTITAPAEDLAPVEAVQINTKQYRVTVRRLDGCFNSNIFSANRGDILDLMPHEAAHLKAHVEEI